MDVDICLLLEGDGIIPLYTNSYTVLLINENKLPFLTPFLVVNSMLPLKRNGPLVPFSDCID